MEDIAKERVVVFKRALFIISIILITSTVTGSSSSVMAATRCPTGIAHRGYAQSGSTENSLNAFNKAFAKGFSWVETDIRFTEDNIAVLMHDTTVNRTTNGSGFVAKKRLAQVQKLKLNDHQTPPTFAELLDLVRGTNRKIMAEIKHPLTARQEKLIVQQLNGLEDQVFLQGFPRSLPSLRDIKKLNNKLHISWLTGANLDSLTRDLEGVNVKHTDLSGTQVAQLHRQGYVVRAWTVNNVDNWRRLKSQNVDAIITDRAAAYAKWVETGCK